MHGSPENAADPNPGARIQTHHAAELCLEPVRGRKQVLRVPDNKGPCCQYRQCGKDESSQPRHS
jgi:hypothetical protein